MTRLLPLILFLCCLVGCVNAQDSTDIKIYNGPRSGAPLKFTTGVRVDSVAQVKFDTVRCMMLMSDTIRQKYKPANVYNHPTGNLTIHTSNSRIVPLVFWDYGYCVHSWFGVYYLKTNKKAFRKEIIVWQHIELEQKQKPF